MNVNFNMISIEFDFMLPPRLYDSIYHNPLFAMKRPIDIILSQYLYYLRVFTPCCITILNEIKKYNHTFHCGISYPNFSFDLE